MLVLNGLSNEQVNLYCWKRASVSALRRCLHHTADVRSWVTEIQIQYQIQVSYSQVTVATWCCGIKLPFLLKFCFTWYWLQGFVDDCFIFNCLWLVNSSSLNCESVASVVTYRIIALAPYDLNKRFGFFRRWLEETRAVYESSHRFNWLSQWQTKEQ